MMHMVPSLPMRGRGLKYGHCMVNHSLYLVAPHAGAWIEIFYLGERKARWKVAPHAGAWIEIYLSKG